MRKWCATALLLATTQLWAPGHAAAFPHAAFQDAGLWLESAKNPVPAGPFAWAHGYLADAAAWEIVAGYPDGDISFCNQGRPTECTNYVTWAKVPSFRPGNTITRAEFGTILARISGAEQDYQPGDTLPFRDTTDRTAWYQPFLTPLFRQDVIRLSDYFLDTLKPDEAITRGEMAAWIARSATAYGITTSGEPLVFTDIPNGYQYMPELRQGVALGLVKGYPDGTFRPGATANRAEATTMLLRLVSRVAKNPPDLSELEAVIRAGLKAYVDLGLDIQRQHDVRPEPAYLWENREAIKAQLSPYFTGMAIDPVYDTKDYGASFKGTGPQTWLISGFTLVNDLHQWPWYPGTIQSIEVAGIQPEVLTDRFARVRVKLKQISNPIGQPVQEYTRTPTIYLKREGSRWLMTSSVEP